MIDIPNSNAQVKCLVGAPQTGRTDALVQEAARRAAEGARVLFVCARERDKRAVSQRIDAAITTLRAGDNRARMFTPDDADWGVVNDAMDEQIIAESFSEKAVIENAETSYDAGSADGARACGKALTMESASAQVTDETIACKFEEEPSQTESAVRSVESLTSDETFAPDDTIVSPLISRDVDFLSGAEVRSLTAGSFEKGEPGAAYILSCAEVAQAVLAASEAQAVFGRGPRVLEPYEETVLLEDLKVSQMKNRRLRKVLAYLRAGWSNLSDDTWEQTAEEDLVIERMRANLRFTGGVLACEASNLALHALREHDALRQRVSWDYVFVDDFELLSRASQHLVRMVAAYGLTVATAERPGLPGDEEYPCFEGAAELLAAFPGAQVARLTESGQAPEVRHRVQGLLADSALAPLIRHDAMGQATPSAEPLDADTCEGVAEPALRMAPSLEAELQALAVEANAALERGESVLIVGTNRLWRRNVAANLQRVGLPVLQLRGDKLHLKVFRDEKQCERARADALYRLRVNAADDVAWRTLLALGDSVARSAAVDYLRQAVGAGAAGAPVRLREALELLDAGNVAADSLTAPLLDDLLAAYRQVKDAFEFEEHAKPGDCVLPREQAVSGEADSQQNDAPSSSKPNILVASPDQAAGLRFDVVVFGGFVNGLIPCRAYCDPVGMAEQSRRREHARDVRTVYGVASCARKRLLFTGFATCSLQAAETMDVHIESIKLRKGLRTVTTQPSELANLLH